MQIKQTGQVHALVKFEYRKIVFQSSTVFETRDNIFNLKCEKLLGEGKEMSVKSSQ